MKNQKIYDNIRLDVNNIDGHQIVVISEYFRSAKKCAKAVLHDIESNESKDQSNFFIEIPKDKYDSVMKILEEHKFEKAFHLKQHIKQGHVTFMQAKRIVKLGKFKDPVIRYHKLSQSIRLIDQYGISSIILFALVQWGHTLEEEEDDEEDEKETKKENGNGLKEVDFHMLKSSKIINSDQDFDFDWKSPTFSTLKLSYKSVLDVTKCLMGDTSKKQMIKNVVCKMGGLGGAVIGAKVGGLLGAYLGSFALPIGGTAMGGYLGGYVGTYVGATGGVLAGTAGGGVVGSKALKYGMNVVIQDDVDRMFLILAQVVHELTIDFMMTEEEVERLTERVRNYENINLKDKLLKMRKDIKLLAQRKKWLRRNIVKPHLVELMKQSRDDVYVPRAKKFQKGDEKEVLKDIKLHPLTMSLLFSDEDDDVPEEIKKMIELEDFEITKVNEKEEKEEEVEGENEEKEEKEEVESLPSPVPDKYDQRGGFGII